MIKSVERYSTCRIKWTILTLDNESADFMLKNSTINIKILTLKSIKDEELKKLVEVRPWNELCWTSASCLLRLVNNGARFGEISAYIDADCFFFQDITEMFLPLFHGQTIAVHEHRFSRDRLNWLAKSGRFNVGVVGGVKGTEFDDCINRWRLQVLESCIVDQRNGKCGDQTYLNEWPDLYKKLVILDEPGVGLAPWNINNYVISQKDKVIYVDDKKLFFYHFHALQFFVFKSKIVIFEAAAGYMLSNESTKIIYQRYVETLINSKAYTKEFGLRVKGLYSIKFIKSVLKKRVFVIYNFLNYSKF